ncbi:hypothetical protein TCE0_044f17309 [Talaromyces pinophilus]|uniref:TauD/TfdA-like domain-containing protein n=1 Tax=Talaromyces pinophilus TaxID=128442 RepID=A0A478EDD4_TALPI|nr:hypothetical protein DPV78_010428 [Talaromyces pinophilus]PCH01997.1 hypothetical protein PENOC_045680 [Penicillium occitanis (nom. inval.)]PCH03032.1 Taurine catabolism dioxygenase TauD/TfdA [Penicillium occitanis (nom. inval.)]GAM42913.1 hypothetical protein TCE0_044f17309 [Talaromyces pinophilus]
MSSTLVQAPTDYSHLPKTEFRTKLEVKPKSASFPDGIKTTGQQPPLYEEVRPYSDFPKIITGPTAWTKDDFSGSPEKEALWKHPFTEEELEELSTAAEQYLASGRSLTEMSKEYFPLPKMAKYLEEVRDDLMNGRGFTLFQGLPVKEWGLQKSATAYMGMGAHFGYITSQNGRGHVLGHVKDLGENPADFHKVRLYRTTARQTFHADPADIVGLLCLNTALEGGENDVVSGHRVWNIMQAERPDVAELLTKPIWYFDRKGEVSVGQEDYIRCAIYYLERDNGRVYSKFDPNYVRSLRRFSDKGIIPPLSEEQEEAIEYFDRLCLQESIRNVLMVGDVHFMGNNHLFHSRTSYKDHPAPAPRRHLLRLWLSTPESEGGWKLPYHDSDWKKRGGVQVDDRPAKVLLHAD